MFRFNNKNLDPITKFDISANSGGHDNPIAYGPGSIINGSIMVTLTKPLPLRSIRAVFKCEETDSSKKSNTTTIFSVDTILWGKARETEEETMELLSGSHMFLFAIRLPKVNYPPSMHDSQSFVGHRIRYILQGMMDLPTTSHAQPHTTSILPIIYLPLVKSDYIEQTASRTQLYENQDKKIQLTAELIKPAYCPGDLCTVKITTNNKSDTKISSIHVSLVATVTTLANNNDSSQESSDNTIHKRHTLFNESFFVSIAKNARDHQEIIKFQLPSNIVPTFTNKLGKYIDISYEVCITLPAVGSSGLQRSSSAAQIIISLPMVIATVPSAYPIDIDVNSTTTSIGVELPTFIPNIESPLPSPVNYPIDSQGRAYSVSPSNSFQIRDDVMDLDEDDEFVLNQDASGHLMVPDSNNTNTRRRSSTSSDVSDSATLVV